MGGGQGKEEKKEGPGEKEDREVTEIKGNNPNSVGPGKKELR